MSEQNSLCQPVCEKYFLITHLGTILGLDYFDRSLKQLSIQDIDEGSHLAVLQRTSEHKWHLILPFPPAVNPSPSYENFLEVEYEYRCKNTCSIKRDGRYLCTDQHGPIAFSRDIGSEWESFVILPVEAFSPFLAFFRNEWLASSIWAEKRPFRPTVQQNGTVRCGSYSFRFSEIANINWWSESHEIAITSGWNIEIFKIFKPAIYFSTFGSDDWFKLLNICLSSLVEFGKYQGAIVIITNRRRASVEQYIPEELRGELDVINLAGSEYTDYAAARYTVYKHQKMYEYQPLIYSDNDVVFDSDIMEVLCAVAQSKSITAQEEPFSRMDQSPSCGSKLFSETGLPAPPDLGFCSGILGVPSMRVAEHWFRLILESVYLRREKIGPLSSGVDQPMMNYLSEKYQIVDKKILTPYIRYTTPFDKGEGLHIAGGDQPRGMVHFWGSHARKISDAEAYVRYLRQSREDNK